MPAANLRNEIVKLGFLDRINNYIGIKELALNDIIEYLTTYNQYPNQIQNLSIFRGNVLHLEEFSRCLRFYRFDPEDVAEYEHGVFQTLSQFRYFFASYGIPLEIKETPPIEKQEDGVTAYTINDKKGYLYVESTDSWRSVGISIAHILQKLLTENNLKERVVHYSIQNDTVLFLLTEVQLRFLKRRRKIDVNQYMILRPYHGEEYILGIYGKHILFIVETGGSGQVVYRLPKYNDFDIEYFNHLDIDEDSNYCFFNEFSEYFRKMLIESNKVLPGKKVMLAPLKHIERKYIKASDGSDTNTYTNLLNEDKLVVEHFFTDHEREIRDIEQTNGTLETLSQVCYEFGIANDYLESLEKSTDVIQSQDSNSYLLQTAKGEYVLLESDFVSEDEIESVRGQSEQSFNVSLELLKNIHGQSIIFHQQQYYVMFLVKKQTAKKRK